MSLLPHNIRPFNEIKSYIFNGYSTLFISGVGTGKSYVTAELIFSLFSGKKVMYVSPKLSIIDYLTKYTPIGSVENVDFVTYNHFGNYAKCFYELSQYDLVVIDEAHHLGSDIYGSNLVKLMTSCKCKFLGLTATPIRDDGTDVSTFFSKVVNGLNHFDAIRLNLMPRFQYLICSPKLDDLTAAERQSYHIDFDNSTIMLKGMLDALPRDKWLVFCTTTEQASSTSELIQSLLSEHKVLTLTSKEGDMEETLAAFDKAEKAVLISCDMLLEGLHPKNVGGILLFRNVQSILVFQQILGRIASTKDANSDPVVIDCTLAAHKILFKILQNDLGKKVTKKSFSAKMLTEKHHSILKVLPLQCIDFYNAMEILEKITKKSVISDNEIYKSAHEYIQKFHVGKDVYSQAKELNKSVIEVATERVSKRNGFIVNFRRYASVQDFCKTFGISVSTLKQSMLIHSFDSYKEAAEYWLNTTAIRVGKHYFKNKKQACLYFDVDYRKALRLSRQLNHTLETVIKSEFYDSPFNYDCTMYNSVIDCCDIIGLEFSDVKSLHDSKNLSWQDSISACLRSSAPSKKTDRSFLYENTLYKNYTACCSEFGLTTKRVTNTARRLNITRSAAITYCLNHPIKK